MKYSVVTDMFTNYTFFKQFTNYTLNVQLYILCNKINLHNTYASKQIDQRHKHGLEKESCMNRSNRGSEHNGSRYQDHDRTKMALDTD